MFAREQRGQLLRNLHQGANSKYAQGPTSWPLFDVHLFLLLSLLTAYLHYVCMFVFGFPVTTQSQTTFYRCKCRATQKAKGHVVYQEVCRTRLETSRDSKDACANLVGPCASTRVRPCIPNFFHFAEIPRCLESRNCPSANML
jgi:hypothetical protein